MDTKPMPKARLRRLMAATAPSDEPWDGDGIDPAEWVYRKNRLKLVREAVDVYRERWGVDPVPEHLAGMLAHVEPLARKREPMRGL
jgi:hypothetical protein